jgi:acyl-CoA synthetase (AMP-forming)/AMP-acid ligase II
MFITDGLKVYHPEIENLLIEHPGVRHAAVIGIPYTMGRVRRGVCGATTGKCALRNGNPGFPRNPPGPL